MILIIGSYIDPVCLKTLEMLKKKDVKFRFLDEDYPNDSRIEYSCSDESFRITGINFTGTEKVSSIFIRHTTLNQRNYTRFYNVTELQKKINVLLLQANCTVINRPLCTYSNYAKPLQLKLLGDSGFEIPRTLVSNVRKDALKFYGKNNRQVIFKGVSNVVTYAQRLGEHNLLDLQHLHNCPAVFQELLIGSDYRVHVVGEKTFTVKITNDDVDYRKSSKQKLSSIKIEPVSLRSTILSSCKAITKNLGLVLSGIDFKEDKDGKLKVLELNPYPQFTFYATLANQPIVEEIVSLLKSRNDSSNVFV